MLPTTAIQAQTPTMSKANKKEVRLSGIEQLVIGLISGGLPSLKLSPIQWIIWVVLVPSMIQEAWEFLQLIVQDEPNPREMRQKKRLRRQQFGHGVISGTAVSSLVQDLMTQPSMFTVLNCILCICLHISWALYWYFPSWTEFQTAIHNPQQQPKTMAFFEPEEKPSLLQLPTGRDPYALPTRPEKRQRLASAA